MRTINNYQNPKLEKEVSNGLEHLTEKVKIISEQMASHNLPLAQGDSMQSHFEEFQHEYQHLIDTVNKELQFQTTSQQVQQSKLLSGKEILTSGNKLADTRTKQLIATTKLKNTPCLMHPKRALLVTIIIAFVCLGEGLFTIPVFEAWQFNFIESFIAALALAGILTVFAHIIPKLIGLGKTIWQMRLIAFAILIFVLSLFIFLSIARSNYIKSVGEANGVHLEVSMWPFIFGSMLFLIVAVGIYYFYMPTKEEKHSLKEYADAEKHKRDCDKEVARLEKDIIQTGQKHTTIIISGTSEFYFGQALEQMIINSAYMAYSLYKRYNLVYRKDGLRPDCFDEPYPFIFTTYFNFPNQTTREIV